MEAFWRADLGIAGQWGKAVDILQGLYDQFVGRDLFGKIGPGAILLAAVALYLDCDLSNASAGDWAFAVVLSWLAGLGIQSFGEWCQLLRYYPRKCCDKKADEKAWHDKVGDMLSLDDYATKYRLGYERLIVIKEACGISCIALALAMILYAFGYGVDHQFLDPAWRRAPVVFLGGLMICALFRMHRKHVARQDDYINRVMEREGRKSKPPSTAAVSG